MKKICISIILLVAVGIFVVFNTTSKQPVAEVPEAGTLLFGTPSGEGTLGEEIQSDETAESEGTDTDISVKPRKILNQNTLSTHIIGNDDRVTIKNTMNYPYSAIGYIEATMTCGCNWTGTGFMVGRRGMLTAAHCLVCQKHGAYASYANFYFGLTPNSGGFSYQYTYQGSYTFWVGTTFRNGYDSDAMNNDYGYILFNDANVGDVTGTFGLWPRNDNDTERTPFTLTGYRDWKLKTDTDYMHVINSNLATCQMDALPGNSGSPVYDSNYMIAGIWVAYSNSGPKTNYVFRIQSWLIDQMIARGVLSS